MCTCERQYYENQLELNKNDLRKVWKIMKEIIGKMNESETQGFECFVGGSVAKDPGNISNVFNDYLFC